MVENPAFRVQPQISKRKENAHLFCICFLVLFGCLFGGEDAYFIALAGLGLKRSACFCLSNAEIKGMYPGLNG